jgi:hypothetical protein
MEDRRPPLPIRIAVLLAAIACLALAMCAHAPKPANAPANASGAAAKSAPDAAPRANDPAYFPATKAAGAIYPQQQGD